MPGPTAADLAKWLKEHPLRPYAGQGVVQSAFTQRPGGRVDHEQPSIEYLLRRGNLWYVRWPNGSIRWESETGLTARGFRVPQQPLLGEVIEE